MNQRFDAHVAVAWVCAAAAALCFATSPARAAPNAAGAPALAEARSPTVTLAVQPEPFGILDDFQVIARVRNDTRRDLTVRDRQICFEPDFVRARGTSSVTTCFRLVPLCDEQDTNCEQADLKLAPGNELLLRYYHRVSWSDLLGMRGPWLPMERYAELIGWSNRPQDVSVAIVYGGSDGATRTVTGQVQMQVAASLLLLLMGVVFGSALLAAFSWAHARRDGALASGSSSTKSVRLFVAGSIAGVILVVLVQRIGDLDLPFKFAINDVIGGVIVGLFSFKLSDKVHAVLFGEPKASDVAQPAVRLEAGSTAAGSNVPDQQSAELAPVVTPADDLRGPTAPPAT